MKKILIDSDICLDTITGRMPYQESADRLLGYIEDEDVIGIISSESFSNMFYILRKLSSSKKALEQIKKLRLLVGVGSIKESTIDSALHSGWSDFEDAIQHFCAIENKCDAIITRNISDFKDSEIPVYTPAQFIEEYLD